MASSSGSLIATKSIGDRDNFHPTSRCCLNTNPTDVVQQNFSSRSRLDLVIEDIVSDNGGDGPEKDQTDKLFRKRLNEMYDRPKVSQLELILYKRITKEEARHILFFPNDDQAGYYRMLIANAPKGAPPEHPQRALQIPHLSLLYLHHWKRWDFVSAFVLAGGLHALSSLFTHENFIVRANAINTFVNITAHRDFDWFARYGDGSTTEARLHRAMLCLRSDPAFIPGLIANSWGTPGGEHDRPAGEKQARTFPGGCLICLEVLAMWLSWVRVLHTVDHRLRLSRSLIRAIENWGGNEAPQTSDLMKEIPMSPTIQPEGEHADETAKDIPQNDRQNRGHLLSGEKTPLAKSVDSLGDSVVTEEGGVEDPQRNVVGTTCQPTGVKTSGRTVIPWPRQETTIEAQRKERAMVLKLAKTLVEDFGRLPPAEQEWEDLRERGSSEGVANGDHVERHYNTASTTALPRETSSTKNANVAAEELNSEMGRNDACVEERSETVAQGRESLSCNGCRGKKENADDGSDGDVEPIRKAEALKTEGNDAFERGNFEAAQRAYSNALSTLDAAGFPAPSLNGTSSRIEGRSPSEANKLRGVLHRNRAAAMLRLFDRAMVSASADSNETTTTNPKVGPNETCRVSDGPAANIDGCSSPQNRSRLSTGREAASDGFPWRTSPSSTHTMDADVEQRAIALLDQCEEDCLRAIEVNATDKKALFRLAKCREIRKRCRRGGMAAASSGSNTEQEQRLRERKAALVAKILARDKDSDSKEETVGGAKGGDTTPSIIKGDTARCSLSVLSQTSEFPTPVGQDMLGAADSNGSGEKQKEDTEVVDSASSTPAPIEGGYATREIRQDVPAVSSTVIGEEKHISPHAADDNNDMAEGYVTGSRKRPQKNTKKKKRNKQHATTWGIAAVELPAIVTGEAGSVPPFPASRERSLLRRLRAFVGRVAVRSKQKQAIFQLETPTRETEVKELWEFLVSLPVECGGLKALLGDDITADSLGCIVRSLSYGCDAEAPVLTDSLKGEGTTGRTVCKLFLELSRVKRVDLALAMCSTADKQALQRVSDHVRRFNLQSSSHTHIEDMCVEIEAAVQKLRV